jgi:2'-hydroxyisoflavone reductase
MGELLDTANATTGGHADLRWTDPQTILDAGLTPWIDLPIWLPPGYDHTFMHGADVTRALDTGLKNRPVTDTVTDTWTWLRHLGGKAPQRPDRTPVGLDPDREAAVLARS